MVDAFGLDVDGETRSANVNDLTGIIRREMFRCEKSRFRVSTKVYDEQTLRTAEAWMIKQGWSFEKGECSVDQVISYSVCGQ